MILNCKGVVHLILMLVLVILELSAQDKPDPSKYAHKKLISKIEFFVGPSIVGMHDDPEYEKYGVLKMGYMGGIGAFHTISKHLELNVKIFFERKGFKEQATSFIPPDFFNNPSTLNLPPVETIAIGDIDNDYLTMSLTPRYFIGKNHKMNLGFGGYYSKLLKSQATITYTQSDQIKLKEVLNLATSYENYDLGLNASIGYSFKALKLTINPQIQYNYGLMNVILLKPGLSPTKNNSLGLILSIVF